MNMIAARARLDDVVLAYAELKNDLLFHKIPRNKILYYINQPLAIGKNQALECRGRHGMDIPALCKERGIEVRVEDRSGKVGQIRFRAEIEFSSREKIITLYKSSMLELQQCSSVLFPDQKFSLEDIMNIHLAHELFHDLEFSGLGFTNEKLDSISSLKWGPIHIRASIIKASEIAAHSFCRYYLGLPFLPNLFDYAHMIQHGSLSAESFWKQVELWTAELKQY